MKRILFVADLRGHSRSLQRMRAMRELGHHVVGISLAPGQVGEITTRPPTFFMRVMNKLDYPVDPVGANAQIIAALKKDEYDVLWVEKGLSIRPSTLRRARRMQPGMKLAFHSDDNMADRHNQSAWFRGALPLYDVNGTHKSYNADPDELPAQGARNMLYFPKTFDLRFHVPTVTDAATRRRLGGRVGFIGSFEAERAQSMLELAQAGIPVRIWGNGWKSMVGAHPNLMVENCPVYGEDYIKLLCCTDVNLGFLRRLNRDLHSDRSVEIPACGAFLLAQRSSEHLQLFEEGREAEYFDSQEELLAKVTRYMEDADARAAITKAGRERALASDYSHDHFVSLILENLFGTTEVRRRKAA